jgi:hypothetical protein
VFLYNPDDVEIILSSHVYIDKSHEYRFFEPWLGNGLLISTGEHLQTRQTSLHFLGRITIMLNRIKDLSHLVYLKRRTQMAHTSQTHSADLPSERPEELHRPVQCQFESGRRQIEEGRREDVRLSRLHERMHSGDTSRLVNT